MFDALVGYLVAELGTAIAMAAYAQRDLGMLLSNAPSFFQGFPRASNVEVRFRLRQLMLDLTEGRWPTQLDMVTVPLGHDPLTAADPWDVPAIKPISAQNIRGRFTFFYESNKDAMAQKYGPSTAAWPSELQFGRAIRNACTHDGKINIANNVTVAWRGLTYSAADNGKEILFKEISTGDLFVLMYEMSALL